MTLTNRLSVFFLTTLGLVLLGFSVTLYLLANAYLSRQVDERLEAAIRTLVAAAEVGPDGVEWESAERIVLSGPGTSGDPVAWRVSDDGGRPIDQSGHAAVQDLLAVTSQRQLATQPGPVELDWQGERWKVRVQRISAPQSDRPRSVSLPPVQDEARKYPALAITAGVSLEPLHATLRQMAAMLTALSLGVWLLSLVAGKRVCRRALTPVTQMAAAAGAMNGDDLSQRLPVARTGDELEDLNNAFNTLLGRLQESFQRQQRFTGDASHQFRTPLAALMGQIEVARRKERTPQEYRRVLDTVYQKASHLKQILESLLFLARANGEAQLPAPELIALDEWLDHHLHTWSEHPRAGDIRVERDSAGLAAVEVQSALLGELVDILLENACKYSLPGTPITLHLCKRGRTVLLAVDDQGCGIREEDLPHVFEPFFRSADARRHGVAGLGLGLAIAKRLAEALGGDLTVIGHVGGKGSRFTIALPINARSAASGAIANGETG